MGAGAAWLAVSKSAAVPSVLALATDAVGVIVGAVIAGLSILVAFFDQIFLRKLRAIGRSPVRYLAPFLFTSVLGVLALICCLTLGALDPDVSRVLYVGLAGLTGFLTGWTIVSLIPGLATLVQFIELKMDALDVPDDVAGPATGAGEGQ